MEREYFRETNCGDIYIIIKKEEKKYIIKTEMKKFGSCAAYEFIGDSIGEALNNGESPIEIATKLKTYKCPQGDNGCIIVIG